jgi:heme-degrading monooxygenase HmoA
MGLAMTPIRAGMTAVIFISTRNEADGSGYAAAAEAMERLAALQPGYVGMDSVRGDDRIGITVSYWDDEAAAVAWRDHPDHAAVRESGRALWYDNCHTIVTTVDRAYSWTRR